MMFFTNPGLGTNSADSHRRGFAGLAAGQEGSMIAARGMGGLAKAAAMTLCTSPAYFANIEGCDLLFRTQQLNWENPLCHTYLFGSADECRVPSVEEIIKDPTGYGPAASAETRKTGEELARRTIEPDIVQNPDRYSELERCPPDEEWDKDQLKCVPKKAWMPFLIAGGAIFVFGMFLGRR